MPKEILSPGNYTFILNEHYNKDMLHEVAILIMDGGTTILPSAAYYPDDNYNIIVNFTLSAQPSESLLLAVYALPGKSVGFDWAALYRGIFTSDTIPAYKSKGFAAELVECRRYFYTTRDTDSYAFQAVGAVRESGKGEIGIRFPIEMYKKPSYKCVGTFMLLPGYNTLTSITVDVIGKKAATLYVNSSNLTTVGAAFVLVGSVKTTSAYSHFEFSADL